MITLTYEQHKKALRMYLTNAFDSKEGLIKLAQEMGISVDARKALLPQNQRALTRQGFWKSLKRQSVAKLKAQFISFFQERGDLSIGKEFPDFDDTTWIVKAIHEEHIVFVYKEGENSRTISNRNVLYLPFFDITLLPGDEEDEFWSKEQYLGYMDYLKNISLPTE